MIFSWDGFIPIPQPDHTYTEVEAKKESTLCAELNFQMAVRIGVHKHLARLYGPAGEIYCELRN